ncbi:MAG: hypothetical protein GW876_09250, partial [Bacteroidetes bacterium]|nr:hypothetical protein [Bacteroidota bacterium]
MKRKLYALIVLMLFSGIFVQSLFAQHVNKINDNKVNKSENQTSVTVNPSVIKTALDFGITPPLSELAPSQGPLSQAEMDANKVIKEMHEALLNADRCVR